MLRPNARPASGTVQDRTRAGIVKALDQAFPPDQAAQDVLGRLIEQIDGLNWPKSGEGKQ